MHRNATKCNKTLSKWCKNKHIASKIMDTLETYQRECPPIDVPQWHVSCCLQQAYSLTHKALLANGDGASFDLVMVEARCILQCVSMRHCSLTAAARFSECMNPRDCSIFYNLLGFFLQSFQDNYFFLVCLLVSNIYVLIYLYFLLMKYVVSLNKAGVSLFQQTPVVRSVFMSFCVTNPVFEVVTVHLILLVQKLGGTKKNYYAWLEFKLLCCLHIGCTCIPLVLKFVSVHQNNLLKILK
jgi:hypothetical protein